MNGDDDDDACGVYDVPCKTSGDVSEFAFDGNISVTILGPFNTSSFASCCFRLISAFLRVNNNLLYNPNVFSAFFGVSVHSFINSVILAFSGSSAGMSTKVLK